MKILPASLRLAFAALLPLLAQCTSTSRKTAPPAPLTAVAAAQPATSPESGVVAPAAAATDAADDLDEYAVVEISDPLERLNRATFWVNDKMYLVLFRPLSKGYEKVVPGRLRKGIYNAFENVKYPVRFVNCVLTGKIKRAGLHTEKFLLNTVAGLGGMIRVTDKMPSLSELPDEDTGKTFANWGMGHGAYIVLPFLGPCSVRDSVGLVGDYALNPVNWGYFWGGRPDWTNIPPSGNTLRALPGQLSTYDETKRDAIDPYIAVRSGYVQYRNEVVKK